MPEFRVVPFGAGGEVIIIGRDDRPINTRTYKSEASALAAIRQMDRGGQRFQLPPNPTPDAPDILDAIEDAGGIHLGRMSKEERENFIRDPHLRRLIGSDNPDNSPDEIARLIAPSEESGGEEQHQNLRARAYARRPAAVTHAAGVEPERGDPGGSERARDAFFLGDTLSVLGDDRQDLRERSLEVVGRVSRSLFERATSDLFLLSHFGLAGARL